MSLDACAEIVRRGDPDRWMSLMAGPVAARARLLPLYAFNLEVARAPWVSAEPLIGQMRLQWWRDALAEIAGGGPVRRHEVVTPLAEVLPAAQAVALDDLVVARHWDLDTAPFEDAAALKAHLEATGGRLMVAAGAVLGAPPQGLAAAGEAGAIAAWLRAAPELAARGRMPLPDDSPTAITALARHGLDRLRAARAARPDPAARPALLALWQVRTHLTRAAGDPGRVAAGALELAPARRSWALLWRQALGRW